MFHKAKGDEVRSRIVARENTDGVFAHENHAGTPTTGDQQRVVCDSLRRMMFQWHSFTPGSGEAFGSSPRRSSGWVTTGSGTW